MIDLFNLNGFSKEFEDFLCLCLSFDRSNSILAKDLLKHSFLEINLNDYISI